MAEYILLEATQQTLIDGEMAVELYYQFKNGPALIFQWQTVILLGEPSGNEFGANPQWLSGGRLPTGKPEVVIWTKGMVKGVDYEVYDLAIWTIYE